MQREALRKALRAPPPRRDPSPPRGKCTPTQRTVLSKLREIHEKLRAEFHRTTREKFKDDCWENDPTGQAAKARQRFRELEEQREHLTKKALRLGLADHPLVKPWLVSRRGLGHRNRLRGTGFEKGVRLSLLTVYRRITGQKDTRLQETLKLLGDGLTIHGAYQRLKESKRLPLNRDGEPISHQAFSTWLRRRGVGPGKRKPAKQES